MVVALAVCSHQYLLDDVMAMAAMKLGDCMHCRQSDAFEWRHKSSCVGIVAKRCKALQSVAKRCEAMDTHSHHNVTSLNRLNMHPSVVTIRKLLDDHDKCTCREERVESCKRVLSKIHCGWDYLSRNERFQTIVYDKLLDLRAQALPWNDSLGDEIMDLTSRYHKLLFVDPLLRLCVDPLEPLTLSTRIVGTSTTSSIVVAASSRDAVAKIVTILVKAFNAILRWEWDSCVDNYYYFVDGPTWWEEIGYRRVDEAWLIHVVAKCGDTCNTSNPAKRIAVYMMTQFSFEFMSSCDFQVDGVSLPLSRL